VNDNELEATRWLEQSRHDAKAADINRRDKLKHVMKLVTELMTKGS
jgi:hypothetical protein